MSARVRRILVGFDGSPAAREALSHGARLARVEHASLVVALVLPWPCLAPGPMTALAAQLVQECEEDQCRALHQAVAQLPQDVSVTFLTRHGRTNDCLRRIAKELNCDVIVVGSPRLARRLRRGGEADGVGPPRAVPAPPRGRPSAPPVSAPAPATPP